MMDSETRAVVVAFLSGAVVASGLAFLWFDREAKELELDVQVLQQADKPAENGHVGVVFQRQSESTMIQRSQAFLHLVNQRRSIRFFSEDPVPDQVLQNCILAAGTAPSGAHCQPWRFCIVKDPAKKAEIRKLVEKEEQLNYDRRMRRSWVSDVEQLVANLHEGSTVLKPYLTDAPALCVLMKEVHGVDEHGEKVDNYYVEQSVGLAAGIFLAALTNVGLCTLTSTPMGAEKGIRELLGRPEREKVFLLLPIGYPAENATVPYRDAKTVRKPLSAISSFH